tara:strand:+ start:1070 stop:1369 length:300 start_codon:yes stop_codon:yes gene_type:complete
MKNWTDIILEAMGEFEYENPGVLGELKLKNEDNIEDHPKWRDASAVVVEPDAYLGRHNDIKDMDLFYDKCDTEGMAFIKGVVQNPLWNHIIDTVEITGY